MDSTVIYQTKGGICNLTLNRPDVFNALNRQLVLDLTAALKQAESETDVRVVILTGAGKAWCAGGDLEELLQLTRGAAAERRAYLTDFKAMIDAVRRISKPVIAAVHGVCVGGGNEINYHFVSPKSGSICSVSLIRLARLAREITIVSSTISSSE